MNKDEEILKEKKLRDKREKILTISSLSYIGLAILIIYFAKPIPILTEVLIPTSIGIAVGLIMSLISIKLSYESSIRLIEIQSTLDEMKAKSDDFDDESPIMILQKRLAMGKVTKAEYENLKSALDN